VCGVRGVPDAAGVSAVDRVERLEGKGQEHRRCRDQTRELVLCCVTHQFEEVHFIFYFFHKLNDHHKRLTKLKFRSASNN
jgi:hypothetical protein